VLGAMAYAVVQYCNTLRGNEGFKLDLGGLRKHIHQGKNHPRYFHCVAPLLGRFKGLDGDRLHLLLMVSEAVSGLKTRYYLKLLAARREEQGLFQGPAFCSSKGNKIPSGTYESIILGALKEHQIWEKNRPEGEDRLFRGVDIDEIYGI
jgi:hypothetical protein